MSQYVSISLISHYGTFRPTRCITVPKVTACVRRLPSCRHGCRQCLIISRWFVWLGFEAWGKARQVLGGGPVHGGRVRAGEEVEGHADATDQRPIPNLHASAGRTARGLAAGATGELGAQVHGPRGHRGCLPAIPRRSTWHGKHTCAALVKHSESTAQTRPRRCGLLHAKTRKVKAESGKIMGINGGCPALLASSCAGVHGNI